MYKKTRLCKTIPFMLRLLILTLFLTTAGILLTACTQPEANEEQGVFPETTESNIDTPKAENNFDMQGTMQQNTTQQDTTQQNTTQPNTAQQDVTRQDTTQQNVAVDISNKDILAANAATTIIQTIKTSGEG